MIRESRNTSQWFKQEENQETVGPGLYNSESATKNKKMSFNLGHVPFGSGNSRFKQDPFYYPGPGSYGTSSFKTTAPRMVYSKGDMEHRVIKKRGVRCQLKLNDEIVDPLEMKRNAQTQKGNIVRGKTFDGCVSPQKSKQKQIYSEAEYQLGPGTYETQKADIFRKTLPKYSFKSAGKSETQSLKQQMEGYLAKVLKNKMNSLQQTLYSGEVSLTQQEGNQVQGVKESPEFRSTTNRHDQTMNKLNPGPGTYTAQYDHKIEHVSPSKFGSTAPRNSQFFRDAIKAPYKDPTYLTNPDPGMYNQSNHSALKSKHKQVINDNMSNTQPSFHFGQKRDLVLSTMPIDQQKVPGPGSYDTSIPERLKSIEQQLSFRYQTRPFGSSNERFEYLKTAPSPREPVHRQIENDLRESSIDTVQRRNMHQEAIEAVRVIEKTKQLSSFKSTTRRFNLANDKDSRVSTMPSYEASIDKAYDSKMSSSVYYAGIHKLGFASSSPRQPLFENRVNNPGPGKYAKAATANNTVYRQIIQSKTKRDKGSYIPEQSQEDRVRGPGAYIQEPPFLKQSYNVSLPPPRFV